MSENINVKNNDEVKRMKITNIICNSDFECELANYHLFCDNQTNFSYSYCHCTTGYWSVRQRQCLAVRLLGESCLIDNHCGPINAYCDLESKLCSCKKNFVMVNGQCIEAKTFGYECISNEECQYYDEYLICKFNDQNINSNQNSTQDQTIESHVPNHKEGQKGYCKCQDSYVFGYSSLSRVNQCVLVNHNPDPYTNMLTIYIIFSIFTIITILLALIGCHFMNRSFNPSFNDPRNDRINQRIRAQTNEYLPAPFERLSNFAKLNNHKNVSNGSGNPNGRNDFNLTRQNLISNTSSSGSSSASPHYHYQGCRDSIHCDSSDCHSCDSVTVHI